MLDLSKTTPTSAAVEPGSLVTVEAAPVSILVQSNDKRHDREFDEVATFASNPQMGSNSDTAKYRKHVSWHGIVKEFLLPCCKMRRTECKYIGLNDVRQVKPSKEEDDSTMPAMPATMPDVADRVLQQDICTSRCRSCRSDGSLTSSSRNVTEKQREKLRSNSDSQMQRPTTQPVTPAR